MALARQGRWAEAQKIFKTVSAAVGSLPIELQRMAMKEAFRSAIEVRDFNSATKVANDIETVGVTPELEPTINVLIGRLYEGLGRNEDALSSYRAAAKSSNRRAAAQGRFELNLRRVGDRVLVSGRADLTSIAVDKADFQLKVSFPGEVVETNGTDDAGTISWNFTPGQVNEISATVTYDDPQAPSVELWTLILGTIVAGTAIGVVLLARRDRNPPAGLPGTR